MQPGVYEIRNTVTGQVYIGSSVRCVFQRRARHFRQLHRGLHENSKLQRSFGVHGKDRFTFRVLEVETDASRLLELERFHIGMHAKELLYNFCTPGHPWLGLSHSPETKAKLKAEWAIVHKDQRNVGHAGRKLSAEHRAKIGLSQKGRRISDEQRVKLRIAQTGRKLTPEHRASMSAAQKQRWKNTREQLERQNGAG